MTHEQSAPVHAVVVGIDYSEVSNLALLEAVRFARQHQQSHIHVVYAAPSTPLPQTLGVGDPTMAVASPTSVDPLNEDTSREVQAHVQKVLSGIEGPPSVTVRWTVHLRSWDAARAICQVAADVEAELIVVGTHGRQGLARFLLGSVAEGVVRLAPCPVLVVRPKGAQAQTEGPAIEPPCPQCLETRRASQGQEFWCERHREHHGRAHTYHFDPFRDSHQSGLLIHPS